MIISFRRWALAGERPNNEMPSNKTLKACKGRLR
jgi:hypothetical protein